MARAYILHGFRQDPNNPHKTLLITHRPDDLFLTTKPREAIPKETAAPKPDEDKMVGIKARLLAASSPGKFLIREDDSMVTAVQIPGREGEEFMKTVQLEDDVDDQKGAVVAMLVNQKDEYISEEKIWVRLSGDTDEYDAYLLPPSENSAPEVRLAYEAKLGTCLASLKRRELGEAYGHVRFSISDSGELETIVPQVECA